MRKYELTAVLAGTISDTDVAALMTRIQNVITDAGATSVESSIMAKHRLSYEINGNKFGHIVNFVFEAAPDVAAKIQLKLKLINEVLRSTLETYVEARLKRTPQLADNPLIKASREKEREERNNERAEREDRGSSQFAASHTPSTPVPQKPNDKPVDLEEIDKKLDQLLEGDLTPTV